MKKKDLSVSAMPVAMYSKIAEQQIIDLLNERLAELHYSINDIRNAGAKIENLEDIKKTTPDNIRKQLAADEAAYFRNMTFVPKSLKRQADEEFGTMERELVPLADKLQTALKNTPISFRFKCSSGTTGDYCVEYDEKEYQEYIKASATTTIDPLFREYYKYLQDFVNSWNDLKTAANKLGIYTPNGNLIKALMGAQDIIVDDEVQEVFGLQTSMDINPERMFGLLKNGVIRLNPNEIESERV